VGCHRIDSGRFLAHLGEQHMSTLTIHIPDGVASQIRKVAEGEGITVDQLLSSAASEKMSAMMTIDYLRERARRAKREDFHAFLAASPDVPPMPGDEL